MRSYAFCDRQELWAVQTDVRSLFRGPGVCRDVSLHQREAAAWLQQSQHSTRTPQATLLMDILLTVARVQVGLQLLTDHLAETDIPLQTHQPKMSGEAAVNCPYNINFKFILWSFSLWRRAVRQITCRCYWGTFCHRGIADTLKMKTACSSETLLLIYQTTRCHNPWY